MYIDMYIIYNIIMFNIIHCNLLFNIYIIYSSDWQPPIDLDCLRSRISKPRPRGVRQDRVVMYREAEG